MTLKHALAAEGVDLGGYTIPEVVEDLEEARTALGYERVNLLSESYGTRVAQVYAAAHPDRVARSVMIGVNPPGRFVWEPAIIDQQLRYYAALHLKTSDSRQTAPDLAEMNLAETMREIIGNLSARWGPVRLDRGKIRFVTFMMLFNRRTAALVFDAYLAAAGDFSGLALLSLASDVVVPRLFTWGDFLAKGATADLEAGRDYATDLDPPDSIIGSPMSLLIFDGLADGAWPVQRPAASPRSAQRSDVASLLLSGTVDFSTPAELATRELLPFLPNGKQVVVAEAGHVDDLWNLGSLTCAASAHHPGRSKHPPAPGPPPADRRPPPAAAALVHHDGLPGHPPHRRPGKPSLPRRLRAPARARARARALGIQALHHLSDVTFAEDPCQLSAGTTQTQADG